jgi:hypothetical protein
MTKITKRFVEALEPSMRDIVKWDDELRGFGVRVKSSGVRSYLVQYRNQYGRSKRYTIGQHGRITAEAARTEAMRLLSDVALGNDPALVRHDLREAPTLHEFVDRYITEWASTRKKPGTLETDRINLRTHIIPALGNLPVADIASIEDGV